MLKLKLNKFSLESIIDTGRVSRVIRRYLREVKTEVERLIRQPKSGHFYRYGRRWIQASAPGEAPAKRSGRLLRSVKEAFPKWTTGELSIGAPYAGYLERGTSRMRKRPFIRPALRTVNSRFTDVRARLG